MSIKFLDLCRIGGCGDIEILVLFEMAMFLYQFKIHIQFIFL